MYSRTAPSQARILISRLVDVHAHLLPGLDDGPVDREAAMSMARAAVEAGIYLCATTPHLRRDFPAVEVSQIAARVALLAHDLEAGGIPLMLRAGAEVSLPWALDASVTDLRTASYGQLGRDLLIEAPASSGHVLPRLLDSLSRRGYRITLAHVERIPELREHPELIDSLIQQGVLLQVNAGSLLPASRGSNSGKFAWHLCESGAAAVVASDGHAAEGARPISLLAEARTHLEERLGTERAEFLTVLAPLAILGGRPVKLPVRATERRWSAPRLRRFRKP